MKIQRTLCRIYPLVWSLLIPGCTDFVETDLPPSQLTSEAVFTDRATATAALANIYAGLRSQTLITGGSRGIGNLLGHYADELEHYGDGIGSIYNFNIHSVLATEPELATLWNNSYNLIYASNSILEGLEDNTALSEMDREQLQGEALFLRGFIHFYLSQLFGDIPYVTQTDYRENTLTGKLESSEIYERLIADLEGAMDLLPESYVVPDRVRVNRYAAMAFLARVALYSGDWDRAVTLSDEVLDRTDLYSWEENLGQVFLKGNQGTLWQLKPVSSGGNTLEAQTFIFESGPPINQGALTQSFMNGFAPGDERAVHWTRGITNGTTVWYHPYKYKANTPTGSSLEHSVVLRLGELYLIRAEAKMQLGDLDGAMADLNKIRGRAGLSDLENLGRIGLETALIKERRYELFTEFGHRWFDLKRFQKVGEVLGPLKPNWQEYQLLFPIPQSELLANPNLNPQNDGY